MKALTLSASFALLASGCGEPESREVSLSDLRMQEDSRYYFSEERIPFTGKATATKGGKVLSTSHILNGHREGEHEVFWPETGERRSLSIYSGGFRHGAFTTWDEKGSKVSESTYRDGVLDGPFKAWFASGALREEGGYSKGKKDGLWTSFYNSTDSAKKSEEIPYETGKVHGEKRAWSRDGHLTYQGVFKEGMRDGRHESWFENGVKRESTYFVNGRPTGLHEGWYDNGQMEYRTLYKDDGTPPTRSLWDRNGNEANGPPPPEDPVFENEP